MNHAIQPDLFSPQEMPFNLIAEERTWFDMDLEMQRRKIEAEREKRQENMFPKKEA